MATRFAVRGRWLLATAPAFLGCSAGNSGGTPTGTMAGAGGAVTSAGAAGTSAAGTAAGGTAAGGSAGTSPTAGASGTTTAGSGGAAAGAAGAGGSAGSASSGGVACPADATFCSGFEDAMMPKDSVYNVNAAPGDWTRDFAVDTAVFHGGKSSLRVKSGSADTGTSGSAYQMLAVPAPMAKFWVRFYIRQADLDIGGLDHNVFAAATDTDTTNSTVTVELAEDVGVAFNTNDVVRWPANFGRVNGGQMPFTLPKGMWHCIEISYDSAARKQQLYVNGTLQIDASDYPAAVATPFKNFKFGFNKLHGPARSVWYDDVAVGPTRAGCL